MNSILQIQPILKKLPILLFLAFSCNVWSQSYSIVIQSETVVPELETTTSVMAIHENLTNSDLNIRMELLDIIAPTEWEILMCTPTICGAPGEYLLDYQLSPMQSAQIRLLFAPGTTTGEATARWVITDLDAPINTDTFNITASTLVGVTEDVLAPTVIIKQSQETIRIEAIGIQTVEVYSITGDLISTRIAERNMISFSRGVLPTGIYLVRLRIPSGTITRKITF